jgi:hypothetical protein
MDFPVIRSIFNGRSQELDFTSRGVIGSKNGLVENDLRVEENGFQVIDRTVSDARAFQGLNPMVEGSALEPVLEERNEDGAVLGAGCVGHESGVLQD